MSKFRYTLARLPRGPLIMTRLGGPGRKKDVYRSAARFAAEADGAAELLDEAEGDAEAEAGAFGLGLGGEEGLEDFFADGRVDAGPIVNDVNRHPKERMSGIAAP